MFGRSSLKRRIQKALNDPHLRIALERASTTFRSRWETAFAGQDHELLRKRLREIKEYSIANLPDLAERFKQEAEKVGVMVYEAKDAEEANRYIANLARARGVTLAVKSKSMLTEEIGLNRYLEERGVRVVETDLGEWIVQLAGERPSHMLAPAVHKTREEVARLFSQTTGQELPPDTSKLVQVARQQLRQFFIEAGMGISGANIAIAESGTLVIVSNEGNARLVTGLPPIHVAVVGYEKIVPRLEEAMAILKVLIPTCMGQRLSSYVSLISGPSRTGDIEFDLTTGVHGPTEVHVVLVDNGRNRLRQEAEFREALYCVRCGACLNICPVYEAVGGHVFGQVHIGGIGSILTAFLNNLSEAAEIEQLCLGCGACVEVCPAIIDIPRMILSLRSRLVADRGLPWIKRLALRGILAEPTRLQSVFKIASVAQRPFTGGDAFIRHLPFNPAVTRFRSLPALAYRPLRERLTLETPSSSQPQGKAAFYAGCLLDWVYPESGEAVVAILKSMGVAVSFPSAQTCCGIPAIYSGDMATAVELARQNIVALEDDGADYIITACPSCGEALKRYFVSLNITTPEWQERARALAAKTFDLSEFLVNVLRSSVNESKGEAPTETVRRITYHDPCHLRRGLGVHREPRLLLSGMAGYELVEMPQPDLCCGLGGTYSFDYPGISQHILEHKLANIAATEASIVVTGCPGCLLQLRGGLDKQGSPVEVWHTADILARCLHADILS
ncbi:MAG: LUD domain-containing protein [Chloroflexi bacterium]|nr:LUD domain-containing protein [Chloroflexota bacterium]